MSGIGWEPGERLMLVAAIGDPDDALPAYLRWRREVDLDGLRGAAVRVLPLLAERASDTDDHPVNHQIAKVSRFSWLKSQLLLTRTLPGVAALLAAGVPVMATKGAAVVHHTHGRLHLRPMDDLDVAVPRTLAGKAARTLMSHGLEASSLPPNPRGAEILHQVHALPFRDAETGAELDLHWQVVHGSLHRRASNEFWDRAVDGDLRGTPVRVLSREDTLVQVVAHGLLWNLERPLQWCADVGLLLRDATVDWDLVAATADRHRVADVLAQGIAGVRELAPSLVPDRLPRALRPGGSRRTGRPHWHEYVRRTVEPGRRPGPRAALGYAREQGRVRAARPATEPGPALRPGDRLSFATHGNGARVLGHGWWAADVFGTWSRGREATLTIPLDGAGAPLVELQVSLVPMVGDALPVRVVDVLLDGRQVAQWHLAGREEHTRVLEIPVPPEGRVADLRLSFAGRVAPAELGVLADHRPTAVALRSVIVGRVVARPPWDPDVSAGEHAAP